jgi:glycosyltransferase involved in cell wall biosynthesis
MPAAFLPAAPQPCRPAPPASPPLVCLVSAAHPPADLRVVGKEGAALAAAGWRVLHLCPGTAAPEQHAGVVIRPYRRGPGWRGRLLGLPALARRARASGAAVLHASEPDAWAAALWAARGGRARVVLDVHEHYPSRLDNRLPAPLRPLARGALRLACRIMAARADAVVLAKDGLAADYAAAPCRVSVRNYAAGACVAPRRHEAGPLTLLHLGALGRERGAFTMLEALARCPPGTRLKLVGRFTDGSEPAFRARAAALGLADRVEHRGWLPHAMALEEAAASADIGLVLFQPGLENHRLALPHKLFDFMLAGLPVIAPAFATEVASVVNGAGNGLLVDSADPAAVAGAVAELACPLRRSRLARRGREAARGRFGWAAEAERLVALYRQLAPLR